MDTEMKNYIGSLLAMVVMLNYCSAVPFNCSQPLEIRHQDKILVKKYICNQEVKSSDLEMEPEIYYDGPLSLHFNYTLLLLESNNNTGSYKIHWFLTDIVPKDRSLTANKTIVEGYKPPMNNATTTFTVLLYKHPNSLHLKSPLPFEINNFIPSSWSEHIPSISLQNNATFHVRGKNVSHLHPHHQILHTSTQNQVPQTHPTVPTMEAPHSTIQIKPNPHDIYNTTNSSSTNHKSPSHHHKNGQSKNVCSFTLMFFPLLSIITKVVF